MNIFVTDTNPVRAAINLDDCRVIKMFLESCQLLSTVAWYQGVTEGFYKPTHKHHPLMAWLREAPENTNWLLSHTNALMIEYRRRFGKHHASEPVRDRAFQLLWSFDTEFPTQFINCARNLAEGVDFSHISDVPTAYRMYLNERWKRAIEARLWNPRKKLPKWTNAVKPDWAEI